MNLIKAIGLGALFWVLIFFEVSILMFGFGLSEGTLYYVIHYVFLVVFSALLGIWYFRKEKKGYGEGLKVALVMLISAIVLDSVITIPLFMNGDYGFLISPMLLIGELIGVVVITVVSGMK